MTRKWSRATHRTVNMLIPVPGLEGGGPGSVLLCAGAWREGVSGGQDPASLPLLLLLLQRTGSCMRARRRGQSTRPSRGAPTCPPVDERGLLLTAHATHVQVRRGRWAQLLLRLTHLVLCAPTPCAAAHQGQAHGLVLLPPPV